MGLACPLNSLKAVARTHQKLNGTWDRHNLHCFKQRLHAEFIQNPVDEWTFRLQFPSALKGSRHGDFVSVFDVGAGWDTGGDASDAKGGEATVEFVGEVAGGGFTFDGGASSEDQFFGS
jgi:hypothetical protein